MRGIVWHVKNNPQINIAKSNLCLKVKPTYTSCSHTTQGIKDIESQIKRHEAAAAQVWVASSAAQQVAWFIRYFESNLICISSRCDIVLV